MCIIDFVMKLHQATTDDDVRKKIACKLNIAQKKKRPEEHAATGVETAI